MIAIEGFEQILKRFDAWYRCSIADRPPVTILNIWRPATRPWPQKEHPSPRDAALDAEYRLDLFEAQLPSRVYLGDAFPTFNPTIGADQTATLFGGELEFNRISSWAVHNLKNIRDILNLQPNFTNPYWAAIRRMTDLSLERSRGRWLTALPVTSYTGDILVSLRGPENLCMDMMDDPEGVSLACTHMTKFFEPVYRDIYDRVAAREEPVTLEGEVTYGKAARPGCDFLNLIPPEMASKYIYPGLEQEINWLDRSYYHLDSAGELPHLDWFLAQPKLCGVQWVYGANRGPASKWIPIYQKIQKAGKAIELLPSSVADAMEVMRHLRPEGVWIKFFGGFGESEARQFVAEVGKRTNWMQ